MTRFGAVLVFKDGVRRAEAEKLLRELGPMLELGEKLDRDYRSLGPETDGAKLLKSFNDEHGGPVWYIP